MIIVLIQRIGSASMYICICAAVTDREISETVRAGAETLEDLRCELGVAMGCGTCKHAAETVIGETKARMAEANSMDNGTQHPRQAAIGWFDARQLRGTAEHSNHPTP